MIPWRSDGVSVCSVNLPLSAESEIAALCDATAELPPRQVVALVAALSVAVVSYGLIEIAAPPEAPLALSAYSGRSGNSGVSKRRFLARNPIASTNVSSRGKFTRTPFTEIGREAD